MIPTVTHQLEAMLDTMTRFVMPAVSSEDQFAQEQAGLVMATLGWLIDVNDSQHAYACAELSDYEALAGALLALPGVDAPALRDALAADVPARQPLGAVLEHTRTLKACTAAVLESVSADVAPAVTTLFLAIADRQAEREQSWCRMTGMPKNVTGTIGEVLDRQASVPVEAPA